MHSTGCPDATGRPGPPDLAAVTDGYSALADVYIERFGSADLADPEDRALIGGWADAVDGRVLDAGCGPGHWSAFLRRRGLEVEGVDATLSFVEHARRTVPDVPFRVGDLRSIELSPGAFGGVLAWFSLIHAEPDDVPAVLRRFSAALTPGGRLLLGFFTGSRLQPFDHRVVTAWAWPTDVMARTVESAGFEVEHTEERSAPNGRRVAAIAARRSP